MDRGKFVFGMEGLDKIYPGALKKRSLIIVAGHPGAGKTTFAATICHANALKNHKSLYITFQEDRDKFYSIMKGLGLEFKELEDKGLFKFVRLPITMDFNDIVEWIMKEVSEEKPHILVIDSINALMGAVVKDEARRAWLQNLFYDLPRQIDGLLILISELEFGSEKLGLGAIEFVADAIFILKHRVEESKLVRIMEVRKIRGAPITVAEIPFAIVSREGLDVYPPPILEELPFEGEKIKIPYTSLREAGMEYVRKGHVIYISYPPDARTWIIYAMLTGVALVNDVKILVISYSHSPKTLHHLAVSMLRKLGASRETAEKLIDKYIVFKGINTFAYSLSQLYVYETELIEKYEETVGAVLFVDSSIPMIYYYPARIGRYVAHLMNQLSILKDMGLLVIRVGSYINDELYRINSMLSDIVFKVVPEHSERGPASIKMVIWRRWTDVPFTLSPNDVEKIIDEAKKIINEKASEA